MSNLLQIGDVIELTDGHKVHAEVPEHFLYVNRRGSWKVVRGGVTVCDEMDYLRGKYIVINTTSDGGGHACDGGYPDGHHVWCQHMKTGHRVDFWQTGSFIVMNKDIKPIGRAAPCAWNVVEVSTARAMAALPSAEDER